jgi:hypothetical protein
VPEVKMNMLGIEANSKAIKPSEVDFLIKEKTDE